MSSIYTRTSIRKFKDKKVEEEKILEILKAGMQAPSACNEQPWLFYVVTNKELINKLAYASPYGHFASKAPCIIVACYKLEGLPAPMFAQIDMSICMENMWLKTDELGLGGTWIGIAPLEDRMKEVHDILNLKDDTKVFSLFPIGYPLETRTQENRFDKTRITYIK